MSEVTPKDLLALLPELEHSRETHRQWRDWHEEDPSRIKRNPEIGDAAFHDSMVKVYDKRIRVVRGAAQALRAEREKRERAYDEARGLAETIHKRRYLRSAPQWEPLDDLVGVLTQVDNMAAGLLADAEKAEAENRRQAQEIERLRIALEVFADGDNWIATVHGGTERYFRLKGVTGQELARDALSTTDTAQQGRRTDYRAMWDAYKQERE